MGITVTMPKEIGGSLRSGCLVRRAWDALHDWTPVHYSFCRKMFDMSPMRFWFASFVEFDECLYCKHNDNLEPEPRRLNYFRFLVWESQRPASPFYQCTIAFQPGDVPEWLHDELHELKHLDAMPSILPIDAWGAIPSPNVELIAELTV